MEEKNRSLGDKVFDITNVILITLFLLITLYPLWYVICASFSDIFEVINQPFLLTPVGFTLKNYQEIFKNDVIWLSFANSFLYMLVGTIINVLITMLAAFPLSRITLPGHKWMTKVIILTMYISGGMIPLYIVVNTLHLRNTIWSMVLPNALSGYFVIIAISFLKNTIPESVQEAARIDGCSHFRMFITIILPLSLPLLGVLALQYGLAHWNSYTQAMIYLDNRKLFPLQLVLREILIMADSQTMNSMMNANVDYEAQTSIREGIKYVSMVVSSVPLLIVYPFLRRFFVTGLTLGGVKE